MWPQLSYNVSGWCEWYETRDKSVKQSRCRRMWGTRRNGERYPADYCAVVLLRLSKWRPLRADEIPGLVSLWMGRHDRRMNWTDVIRFFEQPEYGKPGWDEWWSFCDVRAFEAQNFGLVAGCVATSICIVCGRPLFDINRPYFLMPEVCNDPLCRQIYPTLPAILRPYKRHRRHWYELEADAEERSKFQHDRSARAGLAMRHVIERAITILGGNCNDIQNFSRSKGRTISGNRRATRWALDSSTRTIRRRTRERDPAIGVR